MCRAYIVPGKILILFTLLSTAFQEQWGGLSPMGKELLAQAAQLGIMIDQSHASDAVFDDLIAWLPVPFILSHSAAKSVYNHPRNLDDQRLQQLAAKARLCSRFSRTRD